MKLQLLILLSIMLLLRCSCGGDVAGTADDVNSGSIFGTLLAEDSASIEDTLTVSLYTDDTAEGLGKARSDTSGPVRTMVSTDGTYDFDSLAAGIYKILVTQGGIIVGSKEKVSVGKKQRVEVDITVVIIINQTFNIWNNDNSQDVTINNFYLDNGTVVEKDGGYVLTTVESDTIVFKVEIEKDGETSLVTARIVRQEDGTSTFEIIDNDDEIEISITPGTDPATGFLGTVDIGIGEPGTVRVESKFDTSDVPVKSR